MSDKKNVISIVNKILAILESDDSDVKKVIRNPWINSAEENEEEIEYNQRWMVKTFASFIFTWKYWKGSAVELSASDGKVYGV